VVILRVFSTFHKNFYFSVLIADVSTPSSSPGALREGISGAIEARQFNGLLPACIYLSEVRQRCGSAHPQTLPPSPKDYRN
jgi:hypothetical protein